MNEFKAMWLNYVNFTDRTSVRGYWMAFLVNLIVSFVLGIIVAILPPLAFVTSLYSLAILIPSLAISVRRLRDAGKHWAWLFISLIPLGAIVLIVFLCMPTASSEGNQV